MKHLWIEVDLSGTVTDQAWTEMEQPKGFVNGALREWPNNDHVEQTPHPPGAWGEVYVVVEALHLWDAIRFYKAQDRILALEVEEPLDETGQVPNG